MTDFSPSRRSDLEKRLLAGAREPRLANILQTSPQSNAASTAARTRPSDSAVVC
jgi:hypothetical protein